MAIFCGKCLPDPNAQPVDDGRGLCRSSANLKTVLESTEFLGGPKALAQSRFSKRSPHCSAPFESLCTRPLGVDHCTLSNHPGAESLPDLHELEQESLGVQAGCITHSGEMGGVENAVERNWHDNLSDDEMSGQVFCHHASFTHKSDSMLTKTSSVLRILWKAILPGSHPDPLANRIPII